MQLVTPIGSQTGWYGYTTAVPSTVYRWGCGAPCALRGCPGHDRPLPPPPARACHARSHSYPGWTADGWFSTSDGRASDKILYDASSVASSQSLTVRCGLGTQRARGEGPTRLMRTSHPRQLLDVDLGRHLRLWPHQLQPAGLCSEHARLYNALQLQFARPWQPPQERAHRRAGAPTRRVPPRTPTVGRPAYARARADVPTPGMRGVPGAVARRGCTRSCGAAGCPPRARSGARAKVPPPRTAMCGAFPTTFGSVAPGPGASALHRAP